jgi:hypothetical protein
LIGGVLVAIPAITALAAGRSGELDRHNLPAVPTVAAEVAIGRVLHL